MKRMAMVLVGYKDSPDDAENPMLLVKQADDGESLTLWNTDVGPDEEPLDAAVRAMNEFFVGSYEGHMLMQAGVVPTETTVNHLYFLSRISLLPCHLRKPELGQCIPVQWLDGYLGRMTTNAHAAVSSLQVGRLIDSSILRPPAL